MIDNMPSSSVYFVVVIYAYFRLSRHIQPMKRINKSRLSALAKHFHVASYFRLIY